MSPNTSKTALTRQQFADRLGVHKQTVCRWERAGRINPKYFGPRTVRYTAEYVEALERDGIPDPSPASKTLTLVQG